MPVRSANRAMNLSFAVGLAMLIGKVGAWMLTGSAAILSDAAESIIHVVAVGFAAVSVRLAARPATNRYLYGYERIGFFSAGFEGALIAVAGIGVIVAAIDKWRAGGELPRLGAGAAIVLAAGLVNLALGWYLVQLGRRTHNIILEANGKHVLSDSWTSFGVVVGLALVLITGWRPFDPLCAIAVAGHLFWSGALLVMRSIRGLLDYADPAVNDRLHTLLTEVCHERGVEFHEVRFRSTGQRLIAMAHLLFPATTTIGDAHRIATEIENEVERRFDVPIELLTHLESVEDHASVHAGRPRA
jgi:cation diffusion facilitator family transporter